MASNKPDIKRIETLITEYAETYGIDSNVSKMMEITESCRSSKKIGFFDAAFLAGILGVSPDYITGLSDEPYADDPGLIKLLSDAVRLNGDNLSALCMKSEKYLDIQENLIDFDKAGIVIKDYSDDGELIAETLPERTVIRSMVAERKASYNDAGADPNEVIKPKSSYKKSDKKDIFAYKNIQENTSDDDETSGTAKKEPYEGKNSGTAK